MIHRSTASRTTRTLADPQQSRSSDMAPIGELGGLLVLTQLLTAPIANDTAIETLQLAARQLGWQPVGDVLRSAVERCLARHHLHTDTSGELRLTLPGRQWLVAFLSQRFASLPPVGADMLLACQLIALPRLDAVERARVLRAVTAERRDQLRQRRACDRACPAALRPWQDWSRAHLIADLQRLENLDMDSRAKPQRPPASAQLATATKGFDRE